MGTIDWIEQVLWGIGLLLVLSPALITIGLAIFYKPQPPQPKHQPRGFEVIVQDHNPT
jgi:hypothetical protein